MNNFERRWLLLENIATQVPYREQNAKEGFKFEFKVK